MDGQVRLIQSVQRAMDIFNCFDENHSTLSLNEISHKLNLNINTTRGIMNTLVYNDYIYHDLEHNKYSLGPLFITKAKHANIPQVAKIKRIATNYLNTIAEKYKFTAYLQFISNDKIHTVETIESDAAYYMMTTRAHRFSPLHASASGKILLAFMKESKKLRLIDEIRFEKYTEFTILDKRNLLTELEEIKNSGYSMERQEVTIGISSIATPLFQDEALMGTISVVSSTMMIDEMAEDCIQDLKKYAQEISAQI